MPDKFGRPTFAPEKVPRYSGDGAIELEPECCEKAVCIQRDFNRNALLLFEKYAASYASLLLLRWNTAQLWTCDDEGHTINCPNKECMFGREQIQRVDTMTESLELAIIQTFMGLASCALDLAEEWRTFTQIEQYALALDQVAEGVQAGETTMEQGAGVARMMLSNLKSEAVENDLIALTDLFSPLRPQ